MHRLFRIQFPGNVPVNCYTCIPSLTAAIALICPDMILANHELSKCEKKFARESKLSLGSARSSQKTSLSLSHCGVANTTVDV